MDKKVILHSHKVFIYLDLHWLCLYYRSKYRSQPKRIIEPIPEEAGALTTTQKKVIIPRANPASEFIVANTLAKWKKLEPDEIDCSQGFSQKVVSRSCSVFNSLPASDDFCCLLITFTNS